MDILQQEEEKIARIMQELEDDSINLLDSSEDIVTTEEEATEVVSTKNLNDFDILDSMDSEPVQEEKEEEEKKEEVTESEVKTTIDIQKEETNEEENVDELTTPEEQEVTTVEDDIMMQEVEESEREEVEESEKEESKEKSKEKSKEVQKEESKEKEKAVKKTPDDETPRRGRGRKPKTQFKQSKKEPSLEPEGLDESEQSEGSEGPEEPEQYEIEKIVGHKLYKNRVVKYVIQWKGYGPEDNTSESADTIHHDVPALCADYWDSLPKTTRPLNAPASKNNKRKRVVTEEKASPVKRHKGNLEHVPQHMLERGFKFPKAWPYEDMEWDRHIKRLCAIQLSPIDKTLKLAYIEWINGERTVHTLEECHKKCPMQLINFYEERLRFV